MNIFIKNKKYFKVIKSIFTAIVILIILKTYNPLIKSDLKNWISFINPKNYSFIFFSLYGFAAWSLPLCFIIDSFFIFLENNIFCRFGNFLIPFISTLYLNFNNISNNLEFVPGGNIGLSLVKFFSKYIKNLNFFIYILISISTILILQKNGILFILKYFYKFLEKLQIINFLKFIFNSFFSLLNYLIPTTKYFLPKTPYSLQEMISEAILYDLKELEEIYNINETINDYIPPCKIFKNQNNKFEYSNNISDFELSIFNDAANKVGLKLNFFDFKKGPFITTIIAKPADEEKLLIIKNTEEEFGRFLGKPELRIFYPVENYPFCIGFEYPNDTKKIISFLDYTDSLNSINNENEISILLGVNTDGSPYILNILKAPHLLIAGTTGSGKSNIMHACITSLIWKYTPTDLSIVLIDPKHVEFSFYEKIPHLKYKIAKKIEDIESILDLCINEMNKRYDLLSELKVKNLFELHSNYSQLKKENPYIVIFIDEYADLIIQKKDLELKIITLAQKSRACGIHLILSTQRPSADIISGTLKANIPLRIACKVSSSVNSRIILGVNGAEKLLGYGDMLLLDQNSNIKRLHGVYVDIQNLEKIINSILIQEKYLKKENIKNN